MPQLDSTRVLDGERKMIFYKPLPTSSAGRKFLSKNKVIGVYDKGKPGTVLETQTDIVDAETNEVYVSAIGSAFFVGQGGWGGPKGPKTKNFPPPEGKAPDVVWENQTSEETAVLYRLNGDYNPLHIDPTPGKKMGEYFFFFYLFYFFFFFDDDGERSEVERERFMLTKPY